MLSAIIVVLTVFFNTNFGASIINDDSINLNRPIVEIENGKIQGGNLVTLDEYKFPYVGFQGIPYAEPPVGENRFRAPKRKEDWNGILDASHDSPLCMQPTYKDSDVVMSEDCLYLNVYTPNLNGSYSVMVWIYGGFFLLGSSSKTMYGPDYLIKENVVIVTLNYRVGIFGFLSTEDEVAPGNYALKDQILALKWVQKNIASFGGNPNDVTIFGESAGSASVSTLLQAKTAKGLYHAAIMESGVSLSLFSRTRNPLNAASTTAKLLNISATNTLDLVEQLRMVEPKLLLDVSIANDIGITFMTNPRDGLVFAPSIEPPNDDAVLTEGSYEQLEQGDFNVVPVIVGFNSAEGNPFEEALSNIPLFLMKYDLDHKLLIPIDMNVNDSSKEEVGSKIKTHYFGQKMISFHLESVSKFITDDQFIRPTTEFVSLVSKFTNVFYYEFSYQGFGNRTHPGVGHGEDVAYLWNTSQGSILEADLPTRAKLVKLWTNFAKYKNPTPEIDVILENVTWTPSNSLNFPYLDIGSKLEVKYNPHGTDMEFWSDLYNTYGNPPYDTY